MPKTLLLADDSVTIQKVVGISFASEDVTLVAVDNGDDAIIRAREVRPDAILADVVMPGISGYEVCEAIKADPDLAHIPVLLLTGTFEAFDSDRAARVGAAGHIAKPFEAQALVDQVKELFLANPGPVPAAPPHSESGSSVVDGAEIPTNPNADSFDFFDEDVEDAEVIADPESHDSPVASMESAHDSAFEFGDDDLEYDSDFRDSISIDAELDSNIGHELGAPLQSDQPSDAFSEASSTPLDTTSASGDEPFDFAFDATPGTTDPVSASDDDGMLQGDAQPNLAETVITAEFAGASIEPVSLDPVAREPVPSDLVMTAEAIETDPFEPAMSVSFEPESDPLDDGDPMDAALFESVEAVSLDPEPVETLLAPQPIAEPASEPAMEVMPEPMMSEASETMARAEAVLEQIEPRLREEIHETLEKIAWESFSDVTDAIVRQSVEKVEAIAWEVIPQLAETLIREEIRKLKGDPPEDE